MFEHSADKWVLSNPEDFCVFFCCVGNVKYVSAQYVRGNLKYPLSCWQKHSLGRFVVKVFMEEALKFM